MADIKKINLNGTDYSIVDETSQAAAEAAQSTADSAQSAATAAQSTADSAQSAATAAQSTADSAQSDATEALTLIANLRSVEITYDADNTALVITTEE